MFQQDAAQWTDFFYHSGSSPAPPDEPQHGVVAGQARAGAIQLWPSIVIVMNFV